MAESKGKYKVFYTVDTTNVRCVSGCLKVKAKNADRARAKAIGKLPTLLADIIDIRIHEVIKTKVPGYHPEEDEPDYEPVPDCRCGATSSRGIGHARWCENYPEENY